jgi:hypothetical protein
MKRLMASSRFWLLVLDVSISTIAFFLTLFMKPDDVVKVMGLIGLWQPIFVMMIKGTSDEDVAKAEAAGWSDRSTVLKADVKALTTTSEDTPK